MTVESYFLRGAVEGVEREIASYLTQQNQRVKKHCFARRLVRSWSMESKSLSEMP